MTKRDLAGGCRQRPRKVETAAKLGSEPSGEVVLKRTHLEVAPEIGLNPLGGGHGPG